MYPTVRLTQHRCVQDQAFNAGAARSSAMTRIAGVACGASGVHVLAASCSDDIKVHRRAARVAAGHSAVIAGMAATQLAGAPQPPRYQ